MGGGFAPPDSGAYRPQRGGDNRNFGPNKPPKGRGGPSFGKNRNQEGKVKGPLKELRSGRMFSVDEDARFRDEDEPLIIEDVDLKADEVEPKEEVDVETEKDE